MLAATIAWGEQVEAQILPRAHLLRQSLGRTIALGEICDISSGLYVKTYVGAESEGAVPYIRVDTVRAFVPNLSTGDLAYVDARHIPSLDRVTVSCGDVVLPRTATLGRALVVPKALDGAVMSQHVTRLRLNRGCGYSAHALCAFLNSPTGQAVVRAQASGTTRLELNHDALSNVGVPVVVRDVEVDPELEERFSHLVERPMRAMEEAWRRCDALVGLEQAKSDVPPQRQLFRVSWDEGPFVSSLVPRFHQSRAAGEEARLGDRFKLAALADIADIRRGAGTTSREYEADGLPYLRTSSLVNHGIEVVTEHYGSEATYERHGQGVGAGDVLLTIEGKVGLVALLAPEERVLIKNHIEFIRPKADCPVPAAFISAWLGGGFIQEMLRGLTVVQTTIPGIASASRTLPVPVGRHRAEEQRAFDDEIRAVSDLVEEASLLRVQLRRFLRGATEAMARVLAPG